MSTSRVAGAFKYAGLYAYDFGTHISYGYTAREVEMLRGSYAHGGGRVFEIYRVNEAGGFELRGVGEAPLGLREAAVFLYRDAGAARRAYDALRRAGGDDPLPFPVQVELARLYSFDPANVVSLDYLQAASRAVMSWLAAHRLGFGDEFTSGVDVHARVAASEGLRMSQSRLAGLVSHEDRPLAQVLESVHRARQR